MARTPERDFNKLPYLPLALPHFSLLAVIFLVVVAWIEVRALRLVYTSIGLSPHVALLLLLVSLAGSYLNIPIAQLPGRHFMSGEEGSLGGHEIVSRSLSSGGAQRRSVGSQ